MALSANKLDLAEGAATLGLIFAGAYYPSDRKNANDFFVPMMHLIQVLLSVQGARMNARRVWFYCVCLLDVAMLVASCVDISRDKNMDRLFGVILLAFLLLVVDVSREWSIGTGGSVQPAKTLSASASASSASFMA